MKIIGIEKVSYTNKDNKRIEGTKLYCAGTRDNVNGLFFNDKMAVFVGSDKCTDVVGSLCVGDDIKVLYNEYGSVEEIKTL